MEFDEFFLKMYYCLTSLKKTGSCYCRAYIKPIQFKEGAGENGLNPKVTGFRFMDTVTTGKQQYPGGYGAYFNKAGQTIKPLTGQTIASSNPWWHIPAK